jgi:hypothetical protein
MPSFRRPFLLPLIGALALAGCTTPAKDSSTNFKGPEAEVAKAVDRLQNAKRDAAQICSGVLAPQLARAIAARSNGKSCKDALSPVLDDVDTFSMKVRDVKINGDKATATVASDVPGKDPVTTFSLQKFGQDWKITGLGATKG